ncbi:hypothetical protein K438DRAFT_552223 [Mycena galopus ATCC 62051]|nr:hypothetical protein K438DRAFT_552223 [Mycena galopus ATCC 62051]
MMPLHDKAQRDWRTNKTQMSILEGRAGSAASMETLRRQDISLRQTIHAYRCILSPLRRFPPEILAHIFLLSAPSVSEARYVPWYTSLEGSPWTLAHVSRHWREVALSFPALWSTIIIRNMSDGESEIYSLPMLEAQLARSAKTPLNIIFDYEAFNDPSDGDVVEDALNALMRHSSRWKSLYITESQIPRLVSVRGRLPLLEKLSVFGGEGEEDDDGNSPPPQANYFLPAPRLRNVAADNAFLAFDVPGPS